MRTHILLSVLISTLSVPLALPAQEFREHPLLIVSGEAELLVKPDRAVVRLGMVAQAEQAAAAQDQVNRVMREAIAAIEALGIPGQKLGTAGISLAPVYSESPDVPRRPREMAGAAGQEPFEPRIVAYRAYNTLRIEIDDLAKVGPVIDAGVSSGANQIEGVSFDLADDRDARSRALQAAASEAQDKARDLADAMGVGLGPIWRIEEQHVGVFAAGLDMGMRAMAAEAAQTPVQPGEVRVTASIRVQYRLDE